MTVSNAPNHTDHPNHVNAAAGGKPSQARNPLSALRGFETVGILVVLMVVFSATSSTFLTKQNLVNVVSVQAITAMMTLAVLLPLIIGEFDLSVGYQLGFLAMLEAVIAQHTSNPAVIILSGPVAGALIGLVNGVLTVFAKISAFIATLGVGILLSGATEGLSHGQVVYGHIPKTVTDLSSQGFLSLPLSVWLTLLIGAILFYVLEYTPVGRFWYAIGGSQRVAYLAGIRTNRLRVLGFVFAGVLVGVAANFALAQSGSANPGYGPDLLLPAYAAAFLGVTTCRPGYYNVAGSLIAILLLAVGFNGLSLLGVPFWVQPVFNGAALLVAVLVARQETRQVRVG